MLTVHSTSSTQEALLTGKPLSAASKTLEAGQAGAADTGSGAVSGKDADQAKVSQFGKLMSSLQHLAATDQDAFKAAAQTIADNLAGSASAATDTKQQEAFAAISAQFAEAAKTGDMASLKNVGSALLGVAPGASGGAGGGDVVSISAEGKELASQGGSPDNGSSGTGSAGGEAGSEASADSSGGGSMSGAGAKAAGGGARGATSGGTGGSSSSSSKSVSDIEDEITELNAKISKAQSALQKAQQAAKLDESKADGVQTATAKLSSLNAELAQLQSDKVLAQSEESSGSGSSAAVSGGASMTTHA